MLLAAALVVFVIANATCSSTLHAQEKPKVPPELKAMITSAVGNTIVPAYQFFADLSDKTREAATAWCANPSDETLGSARKAFAGSVHAWARIQHIRFGPARTDNRWQRIAFLPDPRGVVRRQVSRVLSKRAPELLSVKSIADQSAAIQGLPALEILLFSAPKDETPEALKYRCGLTRSIAGHVALLARRMAEDWSGKGGWRQRLLSPGPDNKSYKSPNEAAAELVRSLLTGLQLVREEMLLPWLKAAEAKKSRAGLPFERAGLSRDVVATSVLALHNLHKALHLDHVLSDIVAKDRKKNWMKGWTGNAYDSLERDTKEMILPSAETAVAAASDENIRILKRARFNSNGLRQIIGREIAPASALTIGFNELDGD